MYKDLSKLRREPSFQWGEVKTNTDNKVISFVREATGYDGYLIAANTGMNRETVDFKTKHETAANGKLVYMYTPTDVSISGDFVIDSQIRLDNLMLKQGQFIIVRFSREQ